MDRLVLAYALIAVLLAGIGGAIAYARHNSHLVADKRRRKRESRIFAEQAAARQAAKDRP